MLQRKGNYFLGLRRSLVSKFGILVNGVRSIAWSTACKPQSHDGLAEHQESGFINQEFLILILLAF